MSSTNSLDIPSGTLAEQHAGSDPCSSLSGNRKGKADWWQPPEEYPSEAEGQKGGGKSQPAQNEKEKGKKFWIIKNITVEKSWNYGPGHE